MTSRDMAEFERQLAAVLDRAYAAAYQFTRSPADADDLVQESALLAWRHFGSFRPDSNFRAWFLRILHNKFVSDYRQRRRRGTPVAVEDVSPTELWERSREAGWQQAASDPADAVFSRMDAELIEAAIDRLPDEYREAAILYFLRELSYQEIAEVLSIPLGTVRSRLHRGRALLQRLLWDLATARGPAPPASPEGGPRHD
jgi:RNA polymerase sigma-70 factor (ECF subfamily)